MRFLARRPCWAALLDTRGENSSSHTPCYTTSATQSPQPHNVLSRYPAFSRWVERLSGQANTRCLHALLTVLCWKALCEDYTHEGTKASLPSQRQCLSHKDVLRKRHGHPHYCLLGMNPYDTQEIFLVPDGAWLLEASWVLFLSSNQGWPPQVSSPYFLCHFPLSTFLTMLRSL